ncbi:MAG: hypothetical protein CBC42_00575 [Betaproteobacteria bacterium TMED82]|nr:MAG: hypothetical protein CBC42_00575 [Betaproteobacteria bacterium TMED82]
MLICAELGYRNYQVRCFLQVLKILVTNQKGGVGKSTISANLAHFFATKSFKRTTLIDFDTQASSSKWIRAVKPQKVTVFRATLPLSSSTNRLLIESRKIVSKIAKRSDVVIADLTWFDLFDSEMLLDFDLVIVPTAVSEVELIATMEFANRHEWVFCSTENHPSLVIVPSRVRGDQAINFRNSTERFSFSFLLTPPVLDSIDAKKAFCRQFLFDCKNKKLANSFLNFCDSIVQTADIHFKRLKGTAKQIGQNKSHAKLNSELDYRIKKTEALRWIANERETVRTLEEQVVNKNLPLKAKRLDYLKSEPYCDLADSEDRSGTKISRDNTAKVVQDSRSYSRKQTPVISITRKKMSELPKFLSKQNS